MANQPWYARVGMVFIWNAATILTLSPGSFQLVALIVLLLRFAESSDVETSSPLRILVSGQTNVAVDNILQVICSDGA